MRTSMKRAAVAGCLWAVVLSGCDTGAGPERAAAGRTRGAADFATRPFEGVSLTELRPVAERVFRSYFRMDAASSSATEWVAFPTNIDPREPAGPNVEPTALTEDTAAEERPRETMGDVIGLAPRRYRRTAEMRLVPDQDRVVVQVRVGIQRLTTTERAAFARERGDVLGEVRHIRAYWHRNQTNAGAPGSEKGLYDGWFPPIPDDDKSVDFAQYGYKSIEELVRWRVYNRTGAGLMAELGSHQLDAASIFLGKTHPQAVSGFGDVLYFTDGRQVEDHIFLTFEFPKNSPAKGAVVTYSSINTNVFDGYGEQVMGTKGTLIVQEARDAYVFREHRIGEGGSMRDTRVSWAEDRVGRPVTESGSTARWVSSVETPDTLTSRGYREEQEHMAWLIRNPDKIIWPSAADPHPENDPAKAPFVPRCHGRVALADAVIALVANMAMHKHMRIEFKPEWFDPASPSNPEAEVKA